MLNATQIKRTAVLAVAVAALGSSSAMARPAGEEIAPQAPVAVTTGSAPARVDGMGVRPATAPPVVAPVVRAQSLKTPAQGSGIDWGSVGIGAAAVLALLLMAALAHAIRPRIRPVGTPHA